MAQSFYLIAKALEELDKKKYMLQWNKETCGIVLQYRI